MKTRQFTSSIKRFVFLSTFSFSAGLGFAQSNVFDDIIAQSSSHTALTAAINAAGLSSALQNENATLTVFAPTDAAFTALAQQLGVNVADLLTLPNLSDVLLYHVLGTTVSSNAVTNGAILTPLNAENTLKFTLTSTGSVYANQALVTTADLSTDNGVVHVIDAVLLPNETVVDVALANNFTTLAAAVIQAELLPALTDPFATFTVFAPTNDAFAALATNLDTDLNGILGLPNLGDVLKYHVLGAQALSTSLSNGQLVTPLNSDNTIKLTVKQDGSVFANQAQVTLADVQASNGVVHVIDQVILPAETVVDIAIDNNFTTLTSAVIEAELLPALTNPFTKLTVFAPSNEAFEDLAEALGTDVSALLSLPYLADVLTYHVVAGEVLSTDLSNGTVPTLNGELITVNLDNGVKINDATVTTADVLSDNGVVHIIDKVLLPGNLNVGAIEFSEMNLYPNPAQTFITLDTPTSKINRIDIISLDGRLVLSTTINTSKIDVSSLEAGQYIIRALVENTLVSKAFSKL